MGKVIAFDRNRARSRAQSGTYAERSGAELRLRSGSRIHPFPSKKEGIQVSVVVAACGHPHLLSHCLAALLFQHFDSPRYEIIVVDDRSRPSTRDIVNDWAAHAGRTGPAISYIAHHGEQGPAAARNRGWRAARGHIVAFIDDDTVARPDWLQKGFDAFENKVQAVWGRSVASRTDDAQNGQREAQATERHAFVSSNCFVRKELLETLGGFDERFRNAWADEADLYFRLVDRNARIIHHPSLLVTQPVQPAPLKDSLAQQRHAQFDALLYKKHPRLFRQKIGKSAQWDYYLIVAALMIGLLSAALGQPVAAMAAGGLWLALTLHCFVKNVRHAKKKSRSYLADSALAALLVPPLAVFWRLVGTIKFRVAFF